MTLRILAIDPGNTESAFVVLNEDMKPMRFEKLDNEDLLSMIADDYFDDCQHIAIEMIASYGMSVGASVFDTCVWIGKFSNALFCNTGIKPSYIYRKEEKMCLCGSMKAKDSNIRQALIDRFGVVGTIKNKGWFYGVSKDVWSAIAVAVTYADKTGIKSIPF